MLGHRGKTWLGAVICLLLTITAYWPVQGDAAGFGIFNPLILAASAQTPLEAQMLESASPPASPAPGLAKDQGGAMLRLPQNFRISFRYHRDQPTLGADRLTHSPLLFKYSMDYYLTPNLRVGMSGFLFQPPGDHLSFLRKKNDLVMGWGPSLKYDLGRWSFAFQSQVEKGRDRVRPEDDKDIHSWLRVWYAF
ncbi:MAG: hypothetical protein ACUVXF_00260 [Desulfobaccales bacterium]